MDISAVMNIHDLAMTKTIRQQADTQERQGRVNQQIQGQKANLTAMIGDKIPHAAYQGVFTNTVEQQSDPQKVKIKVKRQVDAQATKKTEKGPGEKVQSHRGSNTTGTLIDIKT